MCGELLQHCNSTSTIFDEEFPLYWATPRAGFKALVASISILRWSFLGAEKVRDAGSKPSRKDFEFVMMDPGNGGCHLTETRLNALLRELEDAA